MEGTDSEITKNELLIEDIQDEEALLQSKIERADMIKIEVPTLKPLVIVGKIDLDAINPKIKPKKKSRAQVLEDKEERMRIEMERRQKLKEARRVSRKGERKKNKDAEEPDISVGDILLLKAKQHKKFGLYFVINKECKAKIRVNKKNSCNFPVSDVKKALQDITAGQILHCRVEKICSDNWVELSWAIKEDPIAKTLLKKDSIGNSINKKILSLAKKVYTLLKKI